MMRNLMRPFVLAVLLLGLLAGGVALGQDVITTDGPLTTGMARLYRDFGDFQTETIALAPFDETTGAALVISTEHHEVHEGEMWHAERTVASVADGATTDLLVRVGGLYEAHTVFEVLASGQVTVSLYESPTVGSEGVEMDVYNMRRTVTETAHSHVFHTPTITSTGSVALVNGRLLPGGTSPTTRVGGGIRQGVEWILAPGTYYLLRVRNNSGAAATINTIMEWYEEEY